MSRDHRIRRPRNRWLTRIRQSCLQVVPHTRHTELELLDKSRGKLNVSGETASAHWCSGETASAYGALDRQLVRTGALERQLVRTGALEMQLVRTCALE